MGFSRETAAERARNDLATRLNIDAGDIVEKSISDREFSDMSLGAAEDGEMAAQMIAYGWVIELESSGKLYEYRADKYQIRRVGQDGKNQLIT